jgi:hypothetical protein
MKQARSLAPESIEQFRKSRSFLVVKGAKLRLIGDGLRHPPRQRSVSSVSEEDLSRCHRELMPPRFFPGKNVRNLHPGKHK